ncbi:hypothetical protein OY671_010878, partial [Metschnikowia pulcherrima]
EVDAIAHVVRCFESTDIVHVSGKVDPIADSEVIDTELALADMSAVERAIDRAAKASKGGDKDAIRKHASFERVKKHLDTVKPVRGMQLTPEERSDSRELQSSTAKPVMYVANVAESGFRNNPSLAAVEKRAASEGAVVVAVCAAMEAEIAQLEEADRADFLKEMGLEEP